MGKYQKIVRLRISKYFAKNLLEIPKGFNMHLYNWNKTGTECDCMFYCSDDFNNPAENKTPEELEYFIITKFGASIVKENIPMVNRQMNFQEDYKINTVLSNNPVLKLVEPSQRTNYKQEYQLEVSSDQLRNINQSLIDLHHNLRTERIRPEKALANGKYIIRVGQW